MPALYREHELLAHLDQLPRVQPRLVVFCQEGERIREGAAPLRLKRLEHLLLVLCLGQPQLRAAATALKAQQVRVQQGHEHRVDSDGDPCSGGDGGGRRGAPKALARAENLVVVSQKANFARRGGVFCRGAIRRGVGEAVAAGERAEAAARDGGEDEEGPEQEEGQRREGWLAAGDDDGHSDGRDDNGDDDSEYELRVQRGQPEAGWLQRGEPGEEVEVDHSEGVNDRRIGRRVGHVAHRPELRDDLIEGDEDLELGALVSHRAAREQPRLAPHPVSREACDEANTSNAATATPQTTYAAIVPAEHSWHRSREIEK